jgi:DNA-binding CsgD family transcriptional regulator
MEGFDQTWTRWEKTNQRQFTNLVSGKYCYHVKAMNVYGTESKEAVIYFEIIPPFFWSVWAKIIYGIFVLVVVFIITRIILWYIAVEKKKLKIKHINELRKKHAASLYEHLLVENRLKTFNEEKLTFDLQHKNSQLALTTMNIMQMNEVFLHLKNELLEGMKEVKGEQRNVLRKIIVSIDNKLKQRENWENFEVHFNTVHNDFLKRLRIDFPELNHRDIRLCAYLRLNLSSKEISNLLGISVRGTESIRYRVRRKLHLKTTDSLTDFLLHY